MNDIIPTPKIKNELHVGGFALYVVAYRRLSETEMKRAASEWLRGSKRKTFPRSGSATMYSTIGFDNT